MKDYIAIPLDLFLSVKVGIKRKKDKYITSDIRKFLTFIDEFASKCKSNSEEITFLRSILLLDQQGIAGEALPL